MNIGQWIMIGVSILLGGWYFAGSLINRRRGIATYHWLQTGLEALGKITEAKWIGSAGSGARLVVGSPNSPYRRIEVVFLLESREIMPLWLFNRVRDKQDEMILKANLRKVPTKLYEAAHESKSQASPSTNGGAGQLPNPAGWEVNFHGARDEKVLSSLKTFLDNFGTSVLQISLQRKTPHLILRANLPTLREHEAEAFFGDMKLLLQ